MDTRDWLRENAPGFQNLCEEELGAITDFLLLWSLFENKMLENAKDAMQGRLPNLRNDGLKVIS